MVQIDISNPFTAAAAGAGDAAAGVVHQHNLEFEQELETKRLALQQAHTELQDRLDQEHAAATQRELERRDSERAGQESALERLAQRKAWDPSGVNHTQDWDEEAALQQHHENERSNVLAGAPKDAEARRTYLSTYWPLMQGEQATEREHLAARGLYKKITGALESGQIPPDKAGVMQSLLPGLRDGTEPLDNTRQVYGGLLDSTKRDTLNLARLSWADQFATQKIGEAGFDQDKAGKLMDAHADWVADWHKKENGAPPDVADLVEKMLRISHGLDNRVVKVGQMSIPMKSPVGQWLPAVEGTAREEAVQIMGKDPHWNALWKNAVSQKDVDRLEPKYEKEKEDIRKERVRYYASRFGATPEMLKALKYDDKSADNEKLRGIKDALKKAGIDPDMPLREIGQAPNGAKGLNPSETKPGHELPEATSDYMLGDQHD